MKTLLTGSNSHGRPRLKLSSSGQYYNTQEIRRHLETNQELSAIKLESLWEDYASEARLINVAEEMRVSERVNESYEPRAEDHYDAKLD